MTDHEQAAESRKDDLALVRTDLANERTLLAYSRTSLMMAATGVTLVKFFPEVLRIRLIGWALVAVGVTIGTVGVTRFVNLHRRLHRSG
ncbi:hypothetical protein K227x_13310 [Rubripirellula lacrimiformis]|uniref:DUF202 domain-containing protein n=1 Tax=Rubripirellula lacrimiformis TaxID=1930273 RepID=A0A517N746_9BACT|nr:DUF202 domain-containing protein [Rubripirellula lacrimiformis]QDT02952.1 hypothetical protein K227x_13310 [Rubripirellula lacrimiformis]